MRDIPLTSRTYNPSILAREYTAHRKMKGFDCTFPDLFAEPLDAEATGESAVPDVECKAAVEKARPKSWPKAVSASANTAGGTIPFGVSDDAYEPVGLENPQDDIVSTVESKRATLIRTNGSIRRHN